MSSPSTTNHEDEDEEKFDVLPPKRSFFLSLQFQDEDLESKFMKGFTKTWRMALLFATAFTVVFIFLSFYDYYGKYSSRLAQRPKEAVLLRLSFGVFALASFAFVYLKKLKPVIIFHVLAGFCVLISVVMSFFIMLDVNNEPTIQMYNIIFVITYMHIFIRIPFQRLLAASAAIVAFFFIALVVRGVSAVPILFSVSVLLMFVFIQTIGSHNAESLLRKIVYEHESISSAKRKAMKRLRDANAAKLVWISQTSHELRSPLNGLLCGLSLLEGTTVDEEQSEFLQICRTSTNHLLKIVNDVLLLLKMHDGKVTIEKEPLNIRFLVEGVSNVFQSLAFKKEKPVELMAVVDSHCPVEVLGDKDRISQVLFNFLSNALKFTDVGSILVSVSYKPPSLFQFAIKDTGSGMSQEDLGHLFHERFFQAEALPSIKRLEGTGLGLHIAYELVTLMNGTIQVKSEKGKGSEFIFEVPLPVLPPLPAPDEIVNSIASPSVPQCLVIFHDEQIRMCISQLFECANSIVSSSSSLSDARAFLQSNPQIDLIVIDSCLISGSSSSSSLLSSKPFSSSFSNLSGINQSQLFEGSSSSPVASSSSDPQHPLTADSVRSLVGHHEIPITLIADLSVSIPRVRKHGGFLTVHRKPWTMGSTLETLDALKNKPPPSSSASPSLGRIVELSSPLPQSIISIEERQQEDHLEAHQYLLSHVFTPKITSSILKNSSLRDDSSPSSSVSASPSSDEGHLIIDIAPNMSAPSLSPSHDPAVAAAAAVDSPLLLPSYDVLVVDDNAINLRVATKILEKANYTCLSAVNGQDAYDKIVANSVKLVLMDIDMPIKNGIEATQLVRSREKELGLPRLPILALTASVLQTQEKGILDAGLDVFLTKPIRVEVLLAAVRRFIGS